jgi:pimeloyl-ACP methyl ester carboxylesterase
MNHHLPTIIFSHGNSFPASTYRVLFGELRRRGFKVKAVEKYGHDERYPVTNNWPHLVQQLADFATEHQQKTGEPVFLVGHSLGGFLSLMAAARHPELACGVLLIDSPILGGWRAKSVGVAKTAQIIAATVGRTWRPPSSTSATRRPSPTGTPRCCATMWNTACTTRTASAC